MDVRWRELERESRAAPGDKQLLNRAITAMRRANVPVPSDLIDLQLHSARTLAAVPSVRFRVYAELPDGEWVKAGDTKAGDVEVPACRVWWVHPLPVQPTPAAEQAIREAEVPGLSLEKTRSCQRYLPRLQHLDHLSWLSLQSTGAGDDALAALPELPHLAELDLAGCKKLTSVGLAHLPRLPNLVRLTTNFCKGIKDWSVLGHLPCLRRLSLHGTNRSIRTLATLPDHLDLTHLLLAGGVQLNPKALEHVARLRRLRELIVSCQMDQAGLDAVCRLTHLRALHMIWGCPWVADLEALTRLPNLEALEVSLDGVDDPRHLGELQGLSLLRLKEPTNEALTQLPRLEGLTHLELHHGDVTRDHLIELVSRCRGLRTLDLNHRLIWAPTPQEMRAGLEPLADSLSELEHLNLRECIGSRKVVQEITAELFSCRVTFDDRRPRTWRSPSERGSTPWTVD